MDVIDTFKAPDTTQRSAAWFEARAGKMTCSCMAQAIGMIDSRKRLWRKLTGREREEWVTPRMQDGTDYEQIATALYEQVTGHKVIPVGFVVHPELEWIGGSPDGLIGVDSDLWQGGIEVKCPVVQYGGIPDYYMPQMQGLMEVTNRPWWDFVVWTPDDVTITRVRRSPEYWQELLVLLSEFWAYVESDVEPPTYKRGTKPKINATVVSRAITIG